MTKEKINNYQIELEHTCFDIYAEFFEICDNGIYFFTDHKKICVLDIVDVYRICRFIDDDFVYDFVNALYYDDEDIILMNLR